MSLSWHRAAYSILRVLVGPFLNHKLNYSCEKVRPKSNPYIVLANHNTDYDPFFGGAGFPRSNLLCGKRAYLQMGIN